MLHKTNHDIGRNIKSIASMNYGQNKVILRNMKLQDTISFYRTQYNIKLRDMDMNRRTQY